MLKNKQISRLIMIFRLLQLLDFGTTTYMQNTGATELNPLMEPIAGNPVAFGAVKAATAMTPELLKGMPEEEQVKYLRAGNILYGIIGASNLLQIGARMVGRGR